MEFIDKLKFDQKGLIPAIIQDERDNRVLMLGYMNRKALRKTFQLGKLCFWSRSRGKLWIKGETSGNFQFVKKIFFDCDNDTLLLKVISSRGGICHLDYRSCFFRKVLKDGKYKIIEKKLPLSKKR